MISSYPNRFWVEISVSVVLLYQIVKLIVWYEVDDMSKDVFADVHNPAVSAAKLLNQFQIGKNENTCKIVNVIHITIVRRIISHQ